MKIVAITARSAALLDQHIMRSPLLHRLIATITLTAYAISGTAVYPALMALAAWMDGSHQVTVSETGHGVHLALRHEGGRYTPAISDHASQAARLLVSLCKPTEEGDHLLCSEQISTTSSQGGGLDSRFLREPPQENIQAAWLQGWQTRPALLQFEAQAHAAHHDIPRSARTLLPLARCVQLMI